VRVVREEPRGVLLSKFHPLAQRQELLVEDVIDERFAGLHPSVDRTWAGCSSLDDHRGGPPPHVSEDEAANYLEIVAALVSSRCLCVLPMVVARALALPTGPFVARPLLDATPATFALAWRTACASPLTVSFGEIALEESGAPRPDGERDAVPVLPGARAEPAVAA
jgi:hypothetical protein